MNNKIKGVVIAIAVLIVLGFVGWSGGIFNQFLGSNTNSQQVATSTNNVNQVNNMNNTQLQIKDEVVGTGAEAVAGKLITVDYVGTFTDGTKFDSSKGVGRKPYQFTLGAGGIIEGWTLGIPGMKVGGKRILVIPPSLGYGVDGYGPIPGNATLIFEVELLSVK